MTVSEIRRKCSNFNSKSFKLFAMKLQILLLAFSAAALGSCSTSYKSGQTPDDVYYSPARPQDEYVRVEQNDDRQYRYDDEYYDDRYLRMKVQNRSRWSELNDWYYYDRYSYSHNYYYGTYNNPYNSWNYYYNPYCHNNVVVVNPKGAVSQNTYVKPRNFSLSGYTNNTYNNSNIITATSKTPRPGISRPVFNNANTTTNSGKKNSSSLSNTIRQIVTGNNNNNNDNNNSTPTRTYTPSNSSSTNSSSSGNNNSSGSSGSSGGGVSRPNRGGN